MADAQETLTEPIPPESPRDLFSNLVMHDCNDMRGIEIKVPEEQKLFARITHEKWGDGEVISVTPGSKVTAHIHFDNPLKKSDGTVTTDLRVDIEIAKLEFLVLPPAWVPEVKEKATPSSNGIPNAVGLSGKRSDGLILKRGMTVIVLEQFSSGVGKFDGFEPGEDPSKARAVIEFVTPSGFKKAYLRVDSLTMYLADGSPNDRPKNDRELNALNKKLTTLIEAFHDYSWSLLLHDGERESRSFRIIEPFLKTCHVVRIKCGNETLLSPDPNLEIRKLGITHKSSDGDNTDINKLKKNLDGPKEGKGYKSEENLINLRDQVEDAIKDVAKTGLRLKYYLDLGKELDQVISSSQRKEILASLNKSIHSACRLGDELNNGSLDWKPTEVDVDLVISKEVFDLLYDAFKSALFICKQKYSTALNNKTRDTSYGVTELYTNVLNFLSKCSEIYDSILASEKLVNQNAEGSQKTDSDEPAQQSDANKDPKSVRLSIASEELLAPVIRSISFLLNYLPKISESHKAYRPINFLKSLNESLAPLIERSKAKVVPENFDIALKMAERSIQVAIKASNRKEYKSTVIEREEKVVSSNLKRLESACKIISDCFIDEPKPNEEIIDDKPKDQLEGLEQAVIEVPSEKQDSPEQIDLDTLPEIREEETRKEEFREVKSSEEESKNVSELFTLPFEVKSSTFSYIQSEFSSEVTEDPKWPYHIRIILGLTESPLIEYRDLPLPKNLFESFQDHESLATAGYSLSGVSEVYSVFNQRGFATRGIGKVSRYGLTSNGQYFLETIKIFNEQDDPKTELVEKLPEHLTKCGLTSEHRLLKLLLTEYVDGKTSPEMTHILQFATSPTITVHSKVPSLETFFDKESFSDAEIKAYHGFLTAIQDTRCTILGADRVHHIFTREWIDVARVIRAASSAISDSSSEIVTIEIPSIEAPMTEAIKVEKVDEKREPYQIEGPNLLGFRTVSSKTELAQFLAKVTLNEEEGNIFSLLIALADRDLKKGATIKFSELQINIPNLTSEIFEQTMKLLDSAHLISGNRTLAPLGVGFFMEFRPKLDRYLSPKP